MKNAALNSIFLMISLSIACGDSGKNTGSSGSGPVSNIVVNAAPTTTPGLPTDPLLKAKVERELQKNGFNEITFDTTTSPPTVRGEYPKGRLAELIQTARLASGGEVQNGATEAK